MRAPSLSSLALSALALAGCETPSPAGPTAAPPPAAPATAAPTASLQPVAVAPADEPAPSPSCAEAPDGGCLEANTETPQDAGASSSSGAAPCVKPKCAHGEEKVKAGTQGARTVRSCGEVIYCKKVWDCPPCGRG